MGGTNTPVRLEGRELELVWSADYRRLLGASRRREALGLPRVPDQEAARRLRRARRGRAAVRTNEAAQQRAARQPVARQRVARPERAPTHVTPPTLVAPLTPTPVAAPPTGETPTSERHMIHAGRQPVTLRDALPPRTYSPCDRCLHCPCSRPKNYSEAQNDYPPLRPSRPTSRRRASPLRPTARTPSPGPP